MKYIFLIFTVALFSCTSKTEDKAVAKVKDLPKMGETFPFSEADRIEVISYPVRYEWDSIRNGKKVYLGNLVENKKLVDTSGIKERIFLNEKLKNELFKSLFIKETSDCSTAACFDPRHAILFYNAKSEIIANLELCFGCGNARATFKYNSLCYESISGVQSIFKEAEIKYYGEGQE